MGILANIRAIVTTMGLAVLALTAHAQSWPSRPIKMIVPSQAGGILDRVHRAIAAQMSESLGQPIIVDNRPGAGGMIGTGAVAKAEPDGYTIGVIATGHSIHPAIIAKMPYHPTKDFSMVSHTLNLTAILVAQPSFAANNIKELIELAKAKPGSVTYGSAGVGQSNHLSGVMFGQLAGIDLVHVPYQGNAPALTGLLGGSISMVFLDMPSAKPQIAAGKLKALAVTGQRRSQAAPEVPLVRETIPGFDGNSWQGIVAPAGTPPEIVQRLSAEVAKAVQFKNLRDQYLPNGVEFVGSTPEQFTALVKAEIERWKTVANAAGIKAE